MKFKISSISILLLLIFSNINAQVTIGSDNEPRKGAILDIKKNNSSLHNPNADGGIGLPRVALVSPIILTIDNDTQKSNYVGVTVYNVTDNADIKKGIYFWDGEKWRLTVSVDNYGMDGELLKSNGDGTFDWSTFVFPEYSFHMPTQISVFESQKATDKIYSYTALTNGGTGSVSGSVKPVSTTFDNAFVYTETLNIQTAALKEKYLLLGIASIIKLATVRNFTAYVGFWQVVQIDVYIDGTMVQSNRRLYPTAAKGDRSMFVDMFSMVSLNQFGKGAHELKIKISNVENTFPDNKGSNDGNFNSTSTDFYSISLKDINLVLYESE